MAFSYRWLELISKVYIDNNWSLSLYITPGTLPFAINIDSVAHEPVDRDSTDLISPRAYIILTDDSSGNTRKRSALEVLRDTLDSQELNLFLAHIGATPSSISGDAFCNITGASLTDENRSIVQIIRDNGNETIWSIVRVCLRCKCLPAPGVSTYTTNDLNYLEEGIWLYEGNERLPEPSDPLWDSPLGQEVHRSAMARRCAYSIWFVTECLPVL
ncbi:hypothetical protein BS47DRAFT_1392692 [Hydnum rufescens UP504]|uniref:Uncharacterized protein n=1 Tax=Hydnum rufescens UP504 TaxID=1448309 RepID=A0A9P6AYL8_9AGAM|nr:hypothetical protein BS47DRAFT_1392692 [Hydnum rufescens UP504]